MKELQALAPNLHLLPSLYLSNQLTPGHIRQAKAGGIVGVKSYPRGVTTNSEGGVGMEGYGVYDAVFAEMEKEDMVLNLHGEVPSDVDGDVSYSSLARGAALLPSRPHADPHHPKRATRAPAS